MLLRPVFKVQKHGGVPAQGFGVSLHPLSG
nr:MAG TPA: hypothetical protein [Inoviridae sp.]